MRTSLTLQWLTRFSAGLTGCLTVMIHRSAVAGDSPASAIPPAAIPAPSGAPAPMADIHDIRPPVPVGLDAPWLVPVLIALAAVVLLILLWWWWRRRRTPRPIETIVPELPPDMVAMQALDRIGDVRGQDGKAFYFQLSAILRQYVCGRYGVGAPEMTTEEFLPCIDRLLLERDLARQLKQLCRAMDPVKFAGRRVDEKQMEGDLFFVRGFVRQTTDAVEMDDDMDNDENSKKQAQTPKQYPTSAIQTK